ncbi:MAG: TPM domain-containing protein [Lutimonas sp.]
MGIVEDFLTPEEEEQIVETIRSSEKETSGEIRVHIENNCKIGCLDRAKEVFNYLGMDKTKDRNGVLFYVSVQSHMFAVIGDSGIDEKVPKNFWDSVKNRVQGEFAKGNFCDGLVLGIIEAGQKLSEFFPFHHTDENQLSNEISKS